MKRYRFICRFISVLLCCAIALPTGVPRAGFASAEGAPSSAASVAYAPGQAIVCVTTGFEERLLEIADSIDVLMTLDRSPDDCTTRAMALATSSKLSTDELVSKLGACDGVVFAEPNFVMASPGDDPMSTQAETAAVATADAESGQSMQEEEPDPEKGTTKVPDLTSRQYAFGESGIDVPRWNTYDEQGNPTPYADAQGRVVAVLDTGVDYNHVDLHDAMWDEGANYPELVTLGGGAHGINVAQPRTDGSHYDTTDPMDDDGHGTHVAGIVASKWNGQGTSGAASGARIMAVKVMNDEGAMGVDEGLRAYRYVIAAQKAGVPVVAINNSWGDEVYSRALDMAAHEAGVLGAVTVFAAGNDREDIDMADQVPNSFVNNPYAIVVGNSDNKGNASESSSFGKRSVDVFAPGQDICSTIVTGTGPGDDAASPLTTDDVTYACGFESDSVKDNTASGVFGFEGSYGTSLSVEEEGHSSSHSLALKGSQEQGSVSVLSKPLNPGGECRGLCLWIKADLSEKVDVMLAYDKADGSSVQHNTTVAGAGWQVVTFPMAKEAARVDLQLNVVFMPEYGSADDIKVLVDDVKLVSKTVDFDFKAGTSQAAPAVAGAVATLAAAFPEDDAAMRAARVVGSVRPMESLADLCVSGGMFSLRKALLGDTAPVLRDVSQTENSLTVAGYFFGSAQGMLAVDGQDLPVTAWSDTSVTAQLPSDFSGGEKLVEISTAEGKKGHQRFRIGTPASLYQRLPLPFRHLFGEPGTYELASADSDQTFYSSAPRALVGLDGDLYYLLETVRSTTAIYRYDIEDRSWELAYEGGHAATGGACTWEGKILFVAGQREENKSYFGFFDPVKRDVEFKPYNDKSFERGCALVNTGKGVLLAGGTKHEYGSSADSSIEIVRTVDPATATVSEVAMPDDTALYGSWYAGAYDEQGRGYLFCGTEMKELYRFSFADGKATCEVLEEGSILSKVNESEQTLSAQADGAVSLYQQRRMVAGPTKAGIIASGPCMTDEDGIVTADTYTLGWKETRFNETNKLVSVTKMYNPAGTTYRGNYYVLADTKSEVGGKVFVSQPVDTIEQPGDVAQEAFPAEEDPTGDPKPTEVVPTQVTQTSAAERAVTQRTTSTLPNTSDKLAPFMLALLAAGALLFACLAAKQKRD